MKDAYSAAGFAKKAGKCCSGDFIVERQLKRGALKLVIADTEVSEATRERYTAACQSRGVPLLFLKDIGCAVGKPAHKLIGITDAGFANMIINAGGEKTPKSNDKDRE